MRHVSVLVTVAKKILPGLATDALGSLGGFAMVKMLKRGREQTGGYMIPIDKIVQLVRYQNMLTTYNKLAEAIRLGSPFIVKETKCWFPWYIAFKSWCSSFIESINRQ